MWLPVTVSRPPLRYLPKRTATTTTTTTTTTTSSSLSATTNNYGSMIGLWATGPWPYPTFELHVPVIKTKTLAGPIDNCHCNTNVTNVTTSEKEPLPHPELVPFCSATRRAQAARRGLEQREAYQVTPAKMSKTVRTLRTC